MRFNKLSIEKFRQFSSKEIFLGNKMTAIAGNNGTGKSTILGILANSSQLSGHHTYLDKPFRGEFSELFSGSPEHDPTGGKITLFYRDRGKDCSALFRTAWQDKKTRFRIIPKRALPDGTITESKLESPVIYLGLSRLYPLGEADRKKLSRKNQKWDANEDRDWFMNKYKAILGGWEELKSVSQFGIAGLARKAGTGIETETYGPSANSAGQDNLGQILLSVLSMRKLKRELDREWDGGLLIIDELDATLHPAAQIRLIKLLLKESAAIGFQVVFTTHSTVILELLSSKTVHNRKDTAGDIEVVYLTDANKRLAVKRNPSWPEMENDLFVKSSGAYDVKVGVFCEDAEARWFASHLIEKRNPLLASRVHFIDAAFGCDELMKLYVGDFDYLRNRIVLFDGDVSDDRIQDKIPESYRKAGGNIVVLPGSKSPEEVVYDYLASLDEDSKLWEQLEPYGFTMRVLNEKGPFSYDFARQSDKRQKFKAWLNCYRGIFDLSHVLDYWAADHTELTSNFIASFEDAYGAIAERTSATELPLK